MTISEKIWNDKYRFEGETLEGTSKRIASALSGGNPDFYNRVLPFLFDKTILPAGRIIAGAGTGRSVTLFNCFVMGTIHDSMSGIFHALREAALTMQQGGGIGYDFSTIRPKGALVKGVAAEASGPLPFMDCWDAMCRTVMSAGSRRGAMMATLRCDHPDIEAFVEAKRDPAKLRMFNLSVLVTDAFMRAVRDGEPWMLQFDGKPYRAISAKALWQRIMQATYDVAEPGVIFIDRINQQNNLSYCETISATNPCGEQPLPPYGACLLGSINLAKLIDAPFTFRARVNWDRLRTATGLAIELLDNVIDVSNFPLPQQAEEARAKRRIGLGITGLADALLMLGIPYGSAEAVDCVSKIMSNLTGAAYRRSAELAREKGPFPLFTPAFLDSPMLEHCDRETLDMLMIASTGIRNSHLISIAPTGTISLYADNVSSGIEPIFAPSYTRKVLQPDGSKVEEEVVDYAVQLWRDLGNTGLPPAFRDVSSITAEEHLQMQAAAQPYVDSSISKTINLPESIPFEDFSAVYLRAYELGLKGCTTYRPNPVTGSVLSVKPKPENLIDKALRTTGITEQLEEPRPRPESLDGTTYKLRWPGSPHALYVTISDLDGAPFEIFINSKNMEHYAWTLGLTRMISAIFRRGGDISFVAEELRAVFDPKGGAWVDGTYIPSLLAMIGQVIERHIVGLEGVEPGDEKREAGFRTQLPPVEWKPPTDFCPQCFSPNFYTVSGCLTCRDCGHSKCG